MHAGDGGGDLSLGSESAARAQGAGHGGNGGFLWAARLPCVELSACGVSATGGAGVGQLDLYVELIVEESGFGGSLSGVGAHEHVI